MLIVEDNESIKQMLVGIFRNILSVSTASDGVEALEMIQKDMPSIILSDVVMPRMSGTELCKQIKTDFNTCHIPVVLLTARTAIEHNIEGLKIGADDYITKPFNTNLLISRCNNLVNSRRLLQEKFSKQPQAFAQMLATNRWIRRCSTARWPLSNVIWTIQISTLISSPVKWVWHVRTYSPN